MNNYDRFPRPDALDKMADILIGPLYDAMIRAIVEQDMPVCDEDFPLHDTVFYGGIGMPAMNRCDKCGGYFHIGSYCKNCGPEGYVKCPSKHKKDAESNLVIACPLCKDKPGFVEEWTG